MNALSRTNARLWLLSAIVFTAFALAGCAQSPEARWAQGRNALTATQDIVAKGHDTGFIDDSTLVNRIDPAIQTARTALETAEGYLPDGGSEFDMWMGMLDAALRRIEEHYTGDPQ